MGCSSSRNTTSTPEKYNRLRQRRSWKSMQLMTPNSADRRLVMALQDLKKQMDEDQCICEEFSFTKIILRLGTVERVLKSVKAVFRSVDHGNKGHVTKNELKEGLHKAKVDLGEEWEDTNIDDCLEHLGDSGGADHDRVGLREFVVMLAVGRVCRPYKRRSSIFVPIDGSGSGIGNSGSGIVSGGGGEEISLSQRKERHPPTMKTINEDEPRRGSMASSVMTEEGENAPVTTFDGQGGGGTALDEEKNGVPCMDDVNAARSKEASEAGVPQLRASAGPGGLPRGNSWRNLMWARIPPLRSLDVSGRSMRGITRTRSNNALVKSAGGGTEGDVSTSVKYVLDLFIAAYFQFDTKAQGYIAKSTLEQKLRQAERESATSSLLDEKRWSELAWEDDRLSFREFIYTFAQWLGLPEDDDDEILLLSQSGRLTEAV